MARAAWVDKLSNILFWDVDRNSVDPEKHIRWIIERILEKGDYQDWVILKNSVTKEEMRKEFERLRVDPKAKNFLKRYIHDTNQTPR
ncbi:MAG: DUF6922 domain-containing protein [Spirochaetaceae bacterium]